MDISMPQGIHQRRFGRQDCLTDAQLFVSELTFKQSFQERKRFGPFNFVLGQGMETYGLHSAGECVS